MKELHKLMAIQAILVTNTPQENLFSSRPRKGIIKNVSKPIPKGHKVFTFEDNFQCTALNLKNANRKHNKWKNGKL